MREQARDLGRGVIEMTALRRSVHALFGFAVAGFVALPWPVPTPGSLPVALPSVSAPAAVVPTVVVVSPSLPALTTPGSEAVPATTPQQIAQPGTASHHSAGTSGTAKPTSGDPPHGVAIPFTTIYVSSPLDIALIGALVTLPLLFGIWLLLFGRTFRAARKAREAQLRLMLAADLGLRPKDLSSMTTRALFDLREKAAFDELTGVLRRASGISVAEREIARARRHDTPLSIAFIDLDGLKQANDRRGHPAGGKLLPGLAQGLNDGPRAEDAVLRYGGDEFVCVLPETAAQGARRKLASIQDVAARARVRLFAGAARVHRAEGRGC